jgi:hypothetical protein
MENQISKQKLVEYLNERIEERSKSMETYTSKGKYYHINESAISSLKSVLFLVEKGMFDEDENIPDGLRQLNEWGEQSI